MQSLVFINCCNNKLPGHVKDFSHHCNMVLKNERDVAPESNNSKKSSKSVNKDHCISKMALPIMGYGSHSSPASTVGTSFPP